MRKKSKGKEKASQSSVGWMKVKGKLSLQVLGLVPEPPGPVYKRVQCFHVAGVGHDFGKVEVVLTDFFYEFYSCDVVSWTVK